MDQFGTLDAALELAGLGYFVVPLHSPSERGCSCGAPDCRSPGKHPRTRNGLKDASDEAAVITEWWNQWPFSNVGILTGAVAGCVVLDVDFRHGGDAALHELESKYGPLPETVETLTGGGGWHIYFAHPGTPIPNSAGKIGPGLDIRGDGGFVVAPPSLHASGRRYTWATGHELSTKPLAPMPAWLFNLIGTPANKTAAARDGERRAIIQGGAPEGTRNTSIASIAGHLLRKKVSAQVVHDLMLAWNAAKNTPPLPDSEVTEVVNNIAGRELERRRGVRHGR